MRLYCTGGNGFVGKALVKAGAIPLNCRVDNYDEVEREIARCSLGVVVHLASKSDVDWCEKREHQEEVIRTNVRGTHNVAELTQRYRLPSVLLSGDHIWDGSVFQRGVYSENSRKTPPVNYYGMSKVAAEQIAEIGGMRIVRTSYIFNKKRLDRKFSGDIHYEPVFIRRSFIYLEDFVELLIRYCEQIYKMPPVLHLAGRDTVSWYEFSKRLPYDVRPRYFEERGFAPRPKHAGLSIKLAQKLGFRIPNYIEGIERMTNEEG